MSYKERVIFLRSDAQLNYGSLNKLNCLRQINLTLNYGHEELKSETKRCDLCIKWSSYDVLNTQNHNNGKTHQTKNPSVQSRLSFLESLFVEALVYSCNVILVE